MPEFVFIIGGELRAFDIEHDGTERHLFFQYDKSASEVQFVAD
jgi:hypothetical protein